MSEYLPKVKFLGTNIKVELDLSNYATRVEFKDEVTKKTEYNELLTKVNNNRQQRVSFQKKMITTKILVKLEIKYIIIIILHKLLLNNFTMRLNQANLTSQNDIANFVNKQILIINSKIALYIV